MIVRHLLARDLQVIFDP